MKIRYYSAVLAILFIHGLTQSVSAQITFTAESFYGPLIGEDAEISQFVGTSTAEFEPLLSMTGPNQTWDVSSATYGEETSLTIRYHEPPYDGFPGGNLPAFAEANFVQELRDLVSEDAPDSVQIFHYSILSSDSILDLGFSAAVDMDDPPDGMLDTMAIVMNPAELEMPFPTTFGDEWESESTQMIMFKGQTLPAGTVKRTHEVVGWGTLVTPAGSADALMIHETTTIAGFVGTTVFQSIEFLAPLQSTGKTGAAMGVAVSLDLDGNGNLTEASYSTIEVEGDSGNPTATEEETELPSSMILGQNYPNPFNPGTVIPFTVEQSSRVTLSVHDVLGRQIDTILDGVVAAGSHQVAWDASGNPSGLYQVVLRSEGEVKTRLVTLQK